MDTQELATALFGKARQETAQVQSVSTLSGVAVSDSENGEVKVKLNVDMSPTSNAETGEFSVVALETTPAVKTGDNVTVTCSGGTLKVMTVTGNVGSGDRTAQEVSDASKVATNYIDIDENKGITVGNMTEETLGKNTYISANGLQIRDGETCLAHFYEDEVKLGEKATVGTLDFCNGAFNIVTTKAGSSYTSGSRNTKIGLGDSPSITLNYLDNRISGHTIGGVINQTIVSSCTAFQINTFNAVQGGTPFNNTLLFAKGRLTIDNTPVSLEGHTHTSADFETVLFSDETGTQDNVTLSESAGNFTYLEIFYGADTYSSVKVFSPDGKAVELENSANGNEVVAISGTTITRGLDTPAFYIQRVVGIK